MSERTGRRISASDVATLAEKQLRPRGLLLGADGSIPELKRSNPLTGLKLLRFAVTDPDLTRRITAPFTVLFHPLAWIPLIALFGCGLGALDVRVGARRARLELVDLHLGAGDLRLGLGERDPERAGVDAEQDFAAAHLLILVDQTSVMIPVTSGATETMSCWT